jgi:hypothetical protein
MSLQKSRLGAGQPVVELARQRELGLAARQRTVELLEQRMPRRKQQRLDRVNENWSVCAIWAYERRPISRITSAERW